MGKLRVLYIQHAGSLGGSIRSLAYTLEALNKDEIEPIVAFLYSNPELMESYKKLGIKTIIGHGIHEFPHTTLWWYPLYSPLGVWGLLKSILEFYPSAKRTERMIKEIQPDIVHLNSLALAPSAWGARMVGVPLVWHVREPVAKGHIGLRKLFLEKLVLRWADEIIFISSYDRERLVKGRRGVVVSNFVDFKKFDSRISGTKVRKEMGLDMGEKIILFLGGRTAVKGIFPLLKSLSLVKEKIPEMHCIIAAGEYMPSNRIISRIARKLLPLVGYGTVNQRINNMLAEKSMLQYVHLLPWRDDVEQLIASSNVVVFPAVEPHFARPAIEAAAMAKPIVASRIGGVEELVEDRVTGFLVPPGDEKALAGALVTILKNDKTAMDMGMRGLERAKKKYSTENVKRIEEAYRAVYSKY